LPLTREEYACVRNFSVLYSGGLDSVAVPLIIGGDQKQRDSGIHLLTYKHWYGTFFNGWSKKHTPELKRILGERVEHHLIDLTRVWNEIGAKRMLFDAMKYGGHWVCCLGCQESMGTLTIAHSLIHNCTNAFICSSVGGEYAVMSMPITRKKNIAFYERFGVRYNAPLLDLGISKPEERLVLQENGMDPGWGARRSHQGYQPICLLGFQHAFDIVFDWHTTYPPDRIAAFLDEKFEIMDKVIRKTLIARGYDPDDALARTKTQYDLEEAQMAAIRARQAEG
jgi:hypothetical protein